MQTPGRGAVRDPNQTILNPRRVCCSSGCLKKMAQRHVYDADSESATCFKSELTKTLSANIGRIKLSPTDFNCVLVVVRVGGLLEWDLLSLASFAMIKKSQDDD